MNRAGSRRMDAVVRGTGAPGERPRTSVPRQPSGRRRWLQRAFGLGAVGTSLAAASERAWASLAEVERLIAGYTGAAAASSDGFTLTLPAIAENGASVPVRIDIDSPMTAEDHVVLVKLFAPANPHPEVLTLRFTPASGVAQASTRMRLAESQNVIAIARLSDGRVLRVEQPVKVTLGGCGG